MADPAAGISSVTYRSHVVNQAHSFSLHGHLVQDPEKDVAADTPVYCYFVSEAARHKSGGRRVRQHWQFSVAAKVTNITIVFVLALMYCVVAPLMMPACTLSHIAKKSFAEVRTVDMCRLG